MKAFLLILGLITATVAVAQEQKLAYDSTLAKKLGADELGMRQYVLVFLKKGPNRLTDSLARVKLQKAHLENIGRLAKMGKLILAGPFMDNQEIRGIYLFAVSSVEEAKELTQTDPAVKAGSLIMELHPWYGSAALMELPNIHPRIQKKSF
ncbi:YciI family protein [Alistipes sp. ZOR0009]|uniref:YciI family protein n=1 Tax=Alistipes sp. ZOR0009 TaxID=1339253 RepID=UPI0006491D0B|nr:YciI family protein [Alistipes sp. ZOR0009]